jgi:mannose-6-phosphate isomerase-like protein (cupin superfamily)
LSAYTIKNLMEIEDSASGQAPGIEARFARRHIDSDHLGVTYISYGPNARSPLGHSHREQEEVYVIVAGSGSIKLNDDVLELRQWDVVRVAPSTLRAVESGPDGLQLIAVGNDRPEGGDGQPAPPEWWSA